MSVGNKNTYHTSVVPPPKLTYSSKASGSRVYLLYKIDKSGATLSRPFIIRDPYSLAAVLKTLLPILCEYNWPWPCCLSNVCSFGAESTFPPLFPFPSHPECDKTLGLVDCLGCWFLRFPDFQRSARAKWFRFS